MKRRSWRCVLSVLGLGLMLWPLVACSAAPPPTAGGPAGLAVEDAWIRPVPQGGNGAVYLTLVNAATEPDRLLAARCPDAAATELHQVLMDGDRMRMAPVEGGLEVPAGGRLELAPAGHHLMVIDLARDLAAGDHLELALDFERAGELSLRVPVALNGPRTGE